MTENTIIPIERVAEKIYLIRDKKVMLDSDLAELYEVPTKRLNEQVKRNIRRFPEDFMFQLTKEEFEYLKSQFATSSWGGRRTMPYVFTEQGVAMLSSVLHSDRAIDINVAIIRTFIRLREMLSTHKDIARKIEEHDQHISNLYTYIEQILSQPKGKKKPIGYIWPKDDE
jgi:phage regulator Rha-like protein